MAANQYQVIEGKDIFLFKGGKSIMFGNNHKLSIKAETYAISSKDQIGSWDVSKVKKLSWSASADGLYSEKGSKELFDAMVAKTPFEVIFASKAEGDTGYAEDNTFDGFIPKAATGYKGKVIITSLDYSAGEDGAGTYTCEFQGVGELSPITA